MLKAATLDPVRNRTAAEKFAAGSRPRVTVTPHDAAISEPEAVAGFIARQIAARARGAPLPSPPGPGSKAHETSNYSFYHPTKARRAKS
jgi:phosphoglycerate dehydrogenase-like enzyme